MTKTQSVPSEVIIRPASPSDVGTLGDFGTRLVALHHELDPQRFLETTDGTPSGYSRFLEKKIADPNAVLLVAVQDDAVLGYSYAQIEGYDYMSLRGPAGVLHDLFVDEGRRREGIGRRLLEAALSEIKKHGSARAVLSTAHRNKAAQQLFASLGFRPTMVEMTCELND
ncbi:GNAT family N-acetyltransferase [Rhizobium sp. Rhizsp42]|uniref:GNAT family N-acetyltransferase n=1 Tax=Rhizobium sp. Rhizsp42 TaxID=3243034 RepID=UPI000DDA7945